MTLCTIAICYIIPIFSHIFAAETPTDNEIAWINAVTDPTDGILAKRYTAASAADKPWVQELNNHVYENADFDETGNLTWATGDLLDGSVQWNGEGGKDSAGR